MRNKPERAKSTPKSPLWSKMAEFLPAWPTWDISCVYSWKRCLPNPNAAKRYWLHMLNFQTIWRTAEMTNVIPNRPLEIRRLFETFFGGSTHDRHAFWIPHWSYLITIQRIPEMDKVTPSLKQNVWSTSCVFFGPDIFSWLYSWSTRLPNSISHDHVCLCQSLAPGRVPSTGMARSGVPASVPDAFATTATPDARWSSVRELSANTWVSHANCRSPFRTLPSIGRFRIQNHCFPCLPQMPQNVDALATKFWCSRSEWKLGDPAWSVLSSVRLQPVLVCRQAVPGKISLFGSPQNAKSNAWWCVCALTAWRAVAKGRLHHMCVPGWSVQMSHAHLPDGHLRYGECVHSVHTNMNALSQL